ncbi:hypothetical protein K5E_10460 [Enterococcus thailandicus]|uniref:Uncharacterized protein n=2 Tax=root TaxID=1 RepID=A0A510W9J5_ENTTH|nr:hypothetical protein ETH01_01760 [Enterococcus thailandicus]GMC00961.1 hypothetical protein K2F_12200 [Enterococcus thailandicus]GMC03724.1 hypothetical protein K4E_12490 [Enterococcus thailandicus]GMC08907.1 hypothetical protein K5E_10460 [Enterococcus thailandicus]
MKKYRVVCWYVFIIELNCEEIMIETLSFFWICLRKSKHPPYAKK